MKYLETKHQQKSAILTVVLMSLLLLVMFFFGMHYQDPPEEYGIAINFGTSEVGNGPPKIQETLQSSPKPSTPKQEVSEVQKAPVEELKEEVVTQNTEEAPVIQKEVVKETVTTPKVIPKEVEKPVVKVAPKPSKATENALSNLLNGNKSDGDPSKGEGDDAQSGLKGNELGDPTSSKYYGNAGTGGDGNYNLSGRNPLGRPKVKPNCNEEGTVVVSIVVDNSGKVIKAEPGVKGTNNTAACLLKAAKEAALKTKWNQDTEAPPTQKGRIIYRFSLSE
jgi:outer membrane biosynthesis protein TonB